MLNSVSDNYVKSLIEKEKFGVLERLALDGYDQLKPVLDKQPLLSPSEEVNKFFLDILPKTQVSLNLRRFYVPVGNIF